MGPDARGFDERGGGEFAPGGGPDEKGAGGRGPGGCDGDGRAKSRQEGDLLEQLRAYEGRPVAEGGRGKDVVNAPMIRHWCEAMGDTAAAYRLPDAVAPPTMLQAWTMGGLSGGSGRSPARDELFALLDGAGYTAVVATDCEQEYLRPLQVGDEITFEAVVESVSGPKTTRLGSGYFVTTRTDIRAGGEPAGVHRFRIFKYAPSGGSPAERRAKAQRDEEPPATGPVPEPRDRAARPGPVVNRDNAGFWQGVQRDELLIQRCTQCTTLRFPWLPGCNSCGSGAWDTVRAAGAGTVFSYVVMHHPPFPAFDPPYAVALVELAEGVRLVSNVVGVPPSEVRIGAAVELEFRQVEEDLRLPVFRMADNPGGAG